MHRPTVKFGRFFLFPALAAAIAACDGAITEPGALSPGTAAAAASEADAAAQAKRLARAFAVALAQPELRAQLRSAMKESRWTEEKLVLQEFARTRAGEALVAAAAREMRTTPAGLQSTIAALPALDFYLPFQAQRQAWRGSPDVLVGSTFDGDAPAIQAYATGGGVKTLRLEDGVPAQPLLILHPAEPKQPAGAQTIEAGQVRTAAGAPRMNTVTQPGVYITHFNIQEGDGWFGSIEIQFHSVAVNGVYPPYSPLNPSSYWIFNESCDKGSHYPTFNPTEDRGYDGQWLLSPGVTNVNYVSCSFYSSTPFYYSIQILEIDGGLNGSNDDFGRRFYYVGGATVGPTLEFRRPSDGKRSAWLRVEYR
ncbi:MAG TPA: hypothetical protein VFS20_15720 [Longimicrobium sp.]|nr:hypothetical protein [Longimicrobium sp.]